MHKMEAVTSQLLPPGGSVMVTWQNLDWCSRRHLGAKGLSEPCQLFVVRPTSVSQRLTAARDSCGRRPPDVLQYFTDIAVSGRCGRYGCKKWVE